MSKLYVGGCSYTAGTDSNDRILWPDMMGYTDVINRAVTVNSNIGIVDRLLTDVKRGNVDKNTTVVIFWSHSERYPSMLRGEGILENSKGMSNQGMHISKFVDNITDINIYLATVRQTLNLMLLAQSYLEGKCKDFFFITTDSYSSFLNCDSQILDMIDHKRVWNWPEQLTLDEELVGQIFDYKFRTRREEQTNQFLSYWLVQSLPLTVCRYLMIGDPDTNYYHQDFKHMGSEAHIKFAEMIKMWIEDNEKDWSYILDMESSTSQKDVVRSVHNGLKTLQEHFNSGEFSDKHWVEESLSAFELAKKAAEFVYED